MTAPRKIRGVYFPMGRPPEAIELTETPYVHSRAPSLLPAMYEAIGCELVEKVTIADPPDGVDIVCDEEGMLRPCNTKGEPNVSNRTWRVFGPDFGPGSVSIVGHALAVGFNEETGEWISLTPRGVVDACARVTYANADLPRAVAHFTPTLAQATAWIERGVRW